jgi:hypothetical protein
MKTKWTSLVLGVLGVLTVIALIVLAGHAPAQARQVDRPPMFVTNVTGDLHIDQPLPGTCSNVDQRSAVTQGWLEIAPSEGNDVPGGKRFVLTRANVSFAPFTIERHCMTEDVTKHFTDVAVQLVRVASFTAAPSVPGIYPFTIPKDDLLFYEVSRVNGNVETGSLRPKQDVTGTIDLATGTFQMTVAVATKFHFELGCAFGQCLFSGDRHGTLTATLSGALVFPDSDGDTVPDRTDNCRFVPNPDQTLVASPVVTAPPDVTIASCADHQIGTAVARDVCDAGPVTVTNNAPATFALGTNVVTWTGQDTKARTASSNQTVTVDDKTQPIFTSVPADIALNDCKATDLGVPIAVDDCAGTLTYTNNAPAKFMVGTTVITWKATDVSGNYSTDNSQKVVVIDMVPPAISCVPAQPQGNVFLVSAIDACTTAPTVRLGSYALVDGERIKIEETGQPGVRLANVIGPERIKHFLVGKGEGVIVATDASSNVASAICR